MESLGLRHVGRKKAGTALALTPCLEPKKKEGAHVAGGRPRRSQSIGEREPGRGMGEMDQK